MGLALAEVARDRGASVTLIAANFSLPNPEGVEVVAVETAEELNHAVLVHEASADVVIMAAAVADFRPVAPIIGKIKKAGREALTIELEPTVDILAGIAERRAPGVVLVGFAAEYGPNYAAEAARKVSVKGVDLIVGNDIADPTIGFDSTQNEVTIFGRDGVVAQPPRGSKHEVAGSVLDAVKSLYVANRAPDDSRRL